MRRKCYECGVGILQERKVPYVLHGVQLGMFPAETCGNCGEHFFSTETSSKIEIAAKKAKLWGLHSRTRVGQSGNSLDIRIARPVAEFVGLSKGVEVLVHPEGKNRLVIERL